MSAEVSSTVVDDKLGAGIIEPGGTGDVANASQNEQPVASKDWATRRAEYAKGDEKVLNKLSRYSSEKDALDALLAAQVKISQGLAKAPVSEAATEEEKTAWREANGIPASAEGYEFELPEGVEEDDDLIAFATKLAEIAHGADIPAAAAQNIFAELAIAQAAEAEAELEREENNRVLARDNLRELWGAEFGANSNAVHNLLSTAPAGLGDAIFNARDETGTPLAHNIELMRWLATVARELNPSATITPISGEKGAQSVVSEMAELQAMMGDPNSRYNTGPEAKKLQERFLELAKFQERQK